MLVFLTRDARNAAKVLLQVTWEDVQDALQLIVAHVVREQIDDGEYLVGAVDQPLVRPYLALCHHQSPPYFPSLSRKACTRVLMRPVSACEP